MGVVPLQRLRAEIRARLGGIVFLVMNDAGDLIRGVAEAFVQGEIVFLFSKVPKIVFLRPENGIAMRSAEGENNRR